MILRVFTLMAIFALFVLSATAYGGDDTGLAKARLMDGKGRTIGYAVITEDGATGVKIALAVKGLSPGPHGLHIHAAGECTPPDFKSAAGHFNPMGRKHGLNNPEGQHAGDLHNLLVDSDGTAAAVRTAEVTLREGKSALLRPGATAIVIHQGPDDYVSDPAGNAGPRVACGVIREVKEPKDH